MSEFKLASEMVAQERIFNVLVEKDEDDYYVGSVVELPGCHTQTKTMDQLNKRIREAIEGYLEVSSKDSDQSLLESSS